MMKYNYANNNENAKLKVPSQKYNCTKINAQIESLRNQKHMALTRVYNGRNENTMLNQQKMPGRRFNPFRLKSFLRLVADTIDVHYTFF